MKTSSFKKGFIKISSTFTRFFYKYSFLSLSIVVVLIPRISHNGFISASGLALKSTHTSTGWTMGFPVNNVSPSPIEDIKVISGYWGTLPLAIPPPAPSFTLPFVVLASQTGQYDSIDFPIQVSGRKPPSMSYQYDTLIIAYTNGIELPLSCVNQLPDQPIWSLNLDLEESDNVIITLVTSNKFGFSSLQTAMLITQIPEPALFLLLPLLLLIFSWRHIMYKKIIAILMLTVICATAQQCKASEFNYQGVVEIEGGAYAGDGYFKFVIGDEKGTTNYWSNDNTVSGEPLGYVYLDVSNGFFSVPLGGSNMATIPRSLFTGNANLYLSIWFNFMPSGKYYKLGERQKILPVPMAVNADMVDGYDYKEIVANTLTSVYNSSSVVTKTKFITSNYTLTSNDQIVLVDTSEGDVIITLPSVKSFPADGYLRKFEIIHNLGSGNVQIKTTGTDKFPYGNTYFNLGKQFFSFTFDAVNRGSNASWMPNNNVTVTGIARRNSSWDADNFTTMTAIPFDDTKEESQSEIIDVSPTGYNTQIKVGTSGRYEISYMININPTDSSWNASAQIYKNGIALDRTSVKTENHGSAEQSMHLIPTTIDLKAGDYLELKIAQDNLFGSIDEAVLNVKITL